jgi:NAD(P)-dependent dehydrogenase (short-subunit alcohol dehydrogenase family)
VEKGFKAARSLSKKVIVKQLDVTDDESIRNLFEFVNPEFGKLDVLINNAGLGSTAQEKENAIAGQVKRMVGNNLPQIWRMARNFIPMIRKAGILATQKKAENVSLMQVKYIMETNFYGHWRMIQAFIPLLEKSAEGRIINISSGMGELNSLTGIYPGYSLSKSSLNALTIMFSNSLKEKNIKVNAMCPGWVKTDMGGSGATREVGEGADTAVWLATEPEIPSGRFFRDRKIIDW